MIPLILPPLTDLNVLVTRPAAQAASLATRIQSLAGNAIVFPTIAIEAIECSPPEAHALVIFVSANAVEFGAKLIRKTAGMRIAAIGKATAAALRAASLPPDVVPEATFTSEALLAHPALQITSGQRVLIVKGSGGRETLRDSFTARGIAVTTWDVYRRVKPPLDTAQIHALETRWADEGVDVVTATSVETYVNLAQLLTERGRQLLYHTPLLAPTQRIVHAAYAAGWRGDALISGGADDESIVRTLSRWHARARST